MPPSNLITSSPSPNTISYTVTSHPYRRLPPFPSFSSSSSTSLRTFLFNRQTIYTLLRHTIRIILTYYALLVVGIKAQTDDFFVSTSSSTSSSSFLGIRGEDIDFWISFCKARSFSFGFLNQDGQQGGWSLTVETWTDEYSWLVVGGVCLGVVYMCLRRDYTEESLLVLQGLGVQTSTSSPYFLMSPSTTFIPTTQIQDIIINEAFKGFEVRFYLAIIVEGAAEIVVVFPVSSVTFISGCPLAFALREEKDYMYDMEVDGR